MASKGAQMSLTDAELEEAIKDIGIKLASPPSDPHLLLLLLDEAENLFSRVEQSPSASVLVAIRPAMKALIAKDLMGHSDMDVKVVITSCLCEITRITAPDTPYDDDLMKEIFGLIVGSFKNLDEMSSRSFPKRVSILETVAKVRSCVLMLDLDCDDLILEMFHHFLKTIRSKHSDTVFSSMATVMTLVLEETESISRQLLSCVLDCLKLVETNILPAAKNLAEKVLVNCSLKLKPYLDELFNDSGPLLSDYNKIVAAVFQGNLVSSIQNGTNAFSENMVDDQKLSEKTLSDNLPQGSAQQEGEIFHPEIAVAAADQSSKSLMSNGSFQIGNGDSLDSKQKNEIRHRSGKSRVNTGASLVDLDILNSGSAKPDSRSDLSSRKGGRNTLLKLSIRNDHYGVSNKKKARANSGRGKGSSKEAEISQTDGLSKEVESAVCSNIGKKNVLELTSGSPDVVASVSMHIPNELDRICPRRGRLSQSSSKRNAAGKAAAGSLTSAKRKKILFSSEDNSLELPIRDLISKESEALGDSERKQLTKKSRSGSAKDGKVNAKDSKSTPTTTIDSDTKLLNRGRNKSQRKVRVSFSEKKQSAGSKTKKGVKPAEADDKELKLKELISSQKSRVKELVKDHNHVKDTNKRKPRWKGAPGIQETSGPRKRRKGLDDTIIGSKIKIWWPDDQRFYDGTVDSFDQSTKMHKILYNDGDVEVLRLKKEQWEFIEGEMEMVREKDKPDVGVSEINLDSPVVSGHLPKHRSRRRVKIPSDEVRSSSSATRTKSRNKHPEESRKANNQTEESSNKLEDDTLKKKRKANNQIEESSNKLEDDTLKKKISRKSKHGPSKISVKLVKDASPPSMTTTTTKTHRKSNGGSSSGSRRKSKNIIHTSMKKSMEGSSSLPESAEGRHKPGKVNQRAEGGKKLTIISHLKLGKTDASSSGKKRKRSRLGK